MFCAINSAGWPGRIRDTPPFWTLLTYFVPSAMITSPSLPPCTAFSVFRTLPSGENVTTSGLPMLTTTMLPCGSMATPFGATRGTFWKKIDAAPSGVIFHTCAPSPMAVTVP